MNQEVTQFHLFVNDLLGDAALAKTIIDAIGYAGMILILLGFYLVSSGKVTGASASYQWINLFGGIGILINAQYFGAMPSVVLNAIWIVIAGVALVKAYRAPRKAAPPTA